RRLEIVRVGAQWHRQLGPAQAGGDEPPRWNVAGPDDAISRIFRFDVRVAAHIASAWWRERGPTQTLDVSFLDAAGEQLGCESWTGQPTSGSRSEGLREGGELIDGAESSSERWYVASVPQPSRVLAPIEAASLELPAPE